MVERVVAPGRAVLSVVPPSEIMNPHRIRPAGSALTSSWSGRPPISRRTLATAAAALIGSLALIAAPAAHANYVASGSDPANDAATPFPGHDIVGVAMVYNPRTGDLNAQVRLRGEPDTAAPANLTVFAGSSTPTGCNGFPAIGFGTLDTARNGDWVRLHASTAAPVNGRASKKGGGEPVQEFSATQRMFRGAKPDCVIATTSDMNNTQNIYDQAGPFTLRGVPGLAVELGKIPSSFRPGQTRTIRATVRNPGHAATGRIRLSVPGAKGMTTSYTRTLGSLAGGKSRTVSLKVTLSSKANTRTRLRVNATTPKKLTARDEGRLVLRKPAAKKGGGGGGGNPTKLCYRYTWLPPYGELVPC